MKFIYFFITELFLLIFISCTQKTINNDSINNGYNGIFNPQDTFFELDTLFFEGKCGTGMPIGIEEEFLYYKYSLGGKEFKEYMNRLNEYYFSQEYYDYIDSVKISNTKKSDSINISNI